MDVDIVVIGAGPSGIQAAIYAARKKAVTIMIGKVFNSAAKGISVENYFGLPGAYAGDELLRNGIKQAETFGCRYLNQNVVSATSSGEGFTIETEAGEIVNAKAVVLATGVHRVKLGVPGEEEFRGKGVSYCSTCDCNFYKGKSVVIVGNESEAALSAELMTHYASKVYWSAPKIDADPSMVRRAKEAGAEVVDPPMVSINGPDKVRSVTFSDGRLLDVDGVFIELGGRSSADLAMDLGIMPEVDDSVKTDSGCRTSVKGVYACGDLTGKPWQIAKAVGQGSLAGIGAADYVKELK
jgi:thioredoxin reductase (NADPH)